MLCEALEHKKGSPKTKIKVMLNDESKENSTSIKICGSFKSKVTFKRSERQKQWILSKIFSHLTLSLFLQILKISVFNSRITYFNWFFFLCLLLTHWRLSLDISLHWAAMSMRLLKVFFSFPGIRITNDNEGHDYVGLKESQDLYSSLISFIAVLEG